LRLRKIRKRTQASDKYSVGLRIFDQSENGMAYLTRTAAGT
jgi:hypothetical protein